MSVIQWQWILVIVSSLLLFVVSPVARTASQFFKASDSNGKTTSIWLLTTSLVMSWIFAKSITNAANLGQLHGFVGGFTYGCYYLSFLVCGIIIYYMRSVGGFQSIHQFLKTRYGSGAIKLFSLLITMRLFNEVWSNTIVIGSYFGPINSSTYYIAILVFTTLTLAYSLKGGLKSTLLTDAIQMVLFGLLLAIILLVILPKENNDINKFISSGNWTTAGGINLLFVVILQIFSYPFHDPVMTDRGFISSPKKTLVAFALATTVGMTCIVLFSFVGIYAGFNKMEGQAAVIVSQTLGVGMMLLMNGIMITSAAATLDSTFSSFSKMAITDLNLMKVTVKNGRIAMIIVAIAGTIPILLSPTVLSATTISGTMVIGLAPVFVLWKLKAPALSFLLSVYFGIFCGILLATKTIPAPFILFDGPYADLLSINLLGTIGCFGLFLVAHWLKPSTIHA